MTTINKPSIIGRGATNLFSDEQEKYNLMTTDGLDDTTARSLITKRRKSLLGEISPEEGGVLKKMIQDGLDSETAVKIVKQNRSNNTPLWKKALKIPFNMSVGATSLATEQVGNALDFVTGGQAGFKEQVEGVKEVTSRSFEGEPGYQAGRNIFGAGEMFAIGPTKLAPTLGGRTLQGAGVGAGIGAGEPILEKGADVTPGEIVSGGVAGGLTGGLATPILEKAVLPVIAGTINKGIKYGTAGVKGGLTGLTKSVSRDIKRPFEKIKLEGLAPNTAYKLSTKANRFNAKDIEDFQNVTKTKVNPVGETPGEFAVKRGMTKVGDEAVDEATKLWKTSMDEADKGLGLIQGNYKINKGNDYLGEMLKDLDTRLTNTLSKDSNKVKLLLNKYNEFGLDMSEINDIKRLYSQNHKYTWIDASSESALRSKNLQDGLRNWQFKVAEEQGFSNLNEINKTTQAWRTFADSLAKKLKRSSGNNNISLTDWVALSGGEPTNVALFLGKKVGELTPVKRALIKGLGKQTKPSIIKVNEGPILQSNIKKQYDINTNLLRDRYNIGKSPQLKLGMGENKGGEQIKTFITSSKKPIKIGDLEKSRPKTTQTKPTEGVIKKPLALPQKSSYNKPIITPQTKKAGVILDSKKGLEKTKFGNIPEEIIKSDNLVNNKILDFSKVGQKSLEQLKLEIQSGLHNDLIEKIYKIKENTGLNADKLYSLLKEAGTVKKESILNLTPDKINSLNQFKKEIQNGLHDNLIKKVINLGDKIDKNILIKQVIKNKVKPYSNTKGFIAPKKIGEDMGVVKKSVSDDLISEAKKFKSADEFISSSNTINPTGKIFTKYTPEDRMKIPLGENIQTLDKSIGGKFDDTISIYRGTKGNKINPGDFITTNKQLAKDYAGNGNVVEIKVKKGDIIDVIDESGGEEYIYRPNAYKEQVYNKSQLKEIYNQAHNIKN